MANRRNLRLTVGQLLREARRGFPTLVARPSFWHVTDDLNQGREQYHRVAHGKGESNDSVQKPPHDMAVALNTSAACVTAATDYLPHSTMVFAHFHVIKLFNDKPFLFRWERKARHDPPNIRSNFGVGAGTDNPICPRRPKGRDIPS